jgi:hypothetical protein
MSGVPVPPAKLSIRQRLRKRFRPTSRASSASPAAISAQPVISSPTLSPVSSSIQNLTSSSPSSAESLAANIPTASAAASLSQQAPSNPSIKLGFLDNALQRLSDRDRATIQECIVTNSGDITSAVEQALTATKEKQRLCIEKRWRFTFVGREFILKEEADKVISWFNRFKAVGNVAVNADPVHAGLPWAGIRFLLEVRVLPPNLKLTYLTLLLTGCRI